MTVRSIDFRRSLSSAEATPESAADPDAEDVFSLDVGEETFREGTAKSIEH